MVSFRYISGVCKQNKTTLSVAQDGPKIKLQSLFISSQIFMDFILQIYISQGSAATQLTSGGMFDNDFLPARRYAARVFARATCPSVRLSVCHEPVLCQNEENVMISSPPGRATIWVFWCQISYRHSGGSPERGLIWVGWENSAIF